MQAAATGKRRAEIIINYELHEFNDLNNKDMEHYNKEDEAALVRTLLYLLRNQRRRVKATKESTREEVLTLFWLLWEQTDDIANQVPGEFTLSILLSLLRRCDFTKIDLSNVHGERAVELPTHPIDATIGGYTDVPIQV